MSRKYPTPPHCEIGEILTCLPIELCGVIETYMGAMKRTHTFHGWKHLYNGHVVTRTVDGLMVDDRCVVNGLQTETCAWKNHVVSRSAWTTIIDLDTMNIRTTQSVYGHPLVCRADRYEVGRNIYYYDHDHPNPCTVVCRIGSDNMVCVTCDLSRSSYLVHGDAITPIGDNSPYHCIHFREHRFWFSAADVKPGRKYTIFLAERCDDCMCVIADAHTASWQICNGNELVTFGILSDVNSRCGPVWCGDYIIMASTSPAVWCANTFDD